jgi:hypothetical protein
MGLLDDAIREHLDLKRRSGGDPAEIARLEQEALGPVRREPEPAAAEPEPLAARDEEPHAEERHEQDAALFDEHAPHDAPAPTEAPPAEPPHAAVPEDDHLHQPTTEYRVEDHHDEDPDEGAPAAPRHPSDEDVLEETPEFLQETPEHDRLWFEQRPPRDFDFDG